MFMAAGARVVVEHRSRAKMLTRNKNAGRKKENNKDDSMLDFDVGFEGVRKRGNVANRNNDCTEYPVSPRREEGVHVNRKRGGGCYCGCCRRFRRWIMLNS